MAQPSLELDRNVAERSRLQVVAPGQPLFPGADRQDSLAHALTAAVREPLIVLDRGLRIVAASRCYRQLFNLSESSAYNLPFVEISSPHWDRSVLELLQDVAAGNTIIEDLEIDLNVPVTGKRRMLLNARTVRDQGSYDFVMIVGLEDLSAKREAEALSVAVQKNQEMLLQEVHHRVANSLQIIASILLLKARAVQSEEIRSHLHDVHHRLISVAAVQRQLSVSMSGSDVELGPYLTSLCDSLASSMIRDDQDVTIAASATGGTIKSEDAVSFGLIVTELVINSLKHGFAGTRKGHIGVDYTLDRAGWRLTVSDDGVGRSLEPADRAPHVGLGTSIVEALARSLKAKVEIGASGTGAATVIIHSA